MKRKMYFVLCLLLLLALCSCAGNEDVTHTTEEKNETTEPIADETTDPVNDDTTEPINDVTTELTADTTAPAPDDVPKENQGAELTYTSGDFSLRTLETGAVNVQSIPIDSERVILTLKMPDNWPNEDLYRIAVYNHAAEEYEFIKDVRCNIFLNLLSYYDGEYLLGGHVSMGERGYVAHQTVAIGKSDGEWYVTVKEVEPGLRTNVPHYSPNGNLLVYRRDVPVEGNPGIYDTQIIIRDSSGNEREILPTEPNMNDRHISEIFAYRNLSFIDDDNLLISIVGYESDVGYNIYNISTDTFREVRGGTGSAIYKDGTVYSLRNYGREVYVDYGDGELKQVPMNDEISEFVEKCGLNAEVNGDRGGYIKNSYFFAKNRDLDSMRIYSPELELIAEMSHLSKAKEIVYAEDYVVMLY